ncbi:MAG: site-specific integrase, partial [Thermogutta sp.]|nr:site-specific integrase [Thermogutta sp.]
GMSARTRNEYRGALSSFAAWLEKNGRLLRNPFRTLPAANVKADRRRERRALTPDEAGRLLYAARWRSLAEYGRDVVTAPKRPGKRASWTYRPLTVDDLPGAVARARERLAKHPEVIARLDAEGRERALLYRLMLYTGLRKNEAATLRIADVRLDADPPCIRLRAENEKNRQGSTIPLRRDLAGAIREHLAGKARVITIGTAPADEPVFDVPAGLLRVFDRDLAVAGIEKRDGSGRTVDLHALRHTAATWLSRARVPAKVAQEVMRHSTVGMTLGVYTHAGLADMAEAVEALPGLEGGPDGDAATL